MRTWKQVSLWSVLALASATIAIGAEPRRGYLTPGEFDVTHVLEPAPRPGDPRYETDRAIFRATRQFVGTPRWTLATSDAVINAPVLLKDFSCSVGVTLTADNAPKLLHVLQQASADTAYETNLAKNFYRRDRPFTIDHGQICQPESELYDSKSGRMSYDYPSGHTTYGWTFALVLSALAPDRATQIFTRGRAYGDSRFVCGAHNESAVEAGFLSASATMNVVSTKPAYQADLAAARTELATLRASGAPPQNCAAEAELTGERVMPGLYTAK